MVYYVLITPTAAHAGFSYPLRDVVLFFAILNLQNGVYSLISFFWSSHGRFMRNQPPRGL